MVTYTKKEWKEELKKDEILIKLKEILGDNYYLIPKDTKKRNISRYPSKN